MLCFKKIVFAGLIYILLSITSSYASATSSNLTLLRASFPTTCSKAGDTAHFMIKNVGADTLNFYVDSFRIEWRTLSGPLPILGGVLVNSGILYPGDSISKLVTSISFAVEGSYSIKSYLHSTWDTIKSNDSIISNLSAVTSHPNVNLSNFNDLCANAPTVTLSGGTPAGGVYSGNGISGSVFQPSTAGPGIHQIKYTYTSLGGCSDSAVNNITLDTVPRVTIAQLNPQCALDTQITLTVGLPALGVYTGSGIVGNQLNPLMAGVGINTITYTYTDLNLCEDSASVQVIIHALPTVSLALTNSHCLNKPPLTLSGGTPQGGTYFGLNVIGTDYVPTGPSSDTVYYRYVDQNGCYDQDTSVINAVSPPTLHFPAIPNQCENLDTIYLTGASPLGGTYKVNGKVNSIYQPFRAGFDTLSYFFVDSNNCSDEFFQIIRVDTIPVVELAPFPNVCQNNQSFELVGGKPRGGVYYGTGVSNGHYYPSNGAVGTDSISYVFFDLNGCGDSVRRPIRILPIPLVSIGAIPAYCDRDSSFELSTGTPIGGVYTGSGVMAGRFHPDSSRIGSNLITYTFTDSNNCSSSADTTLLLEPNPTFDLGPDQEICGDQQLTLKVGRSNMKYKWNTGDTLEEISVLVSGVYSVSVTDINTISKCYFEDAVRVDYDAVCMGISQGEAAHIDWNVYPNPTSGLLVVSFDNRGVNQAEVSIHNISGELIKIKVASTNEGGNTTIFDLSEVPLGLYFVQAKTTTQVLKKKILIQ